MANPLNVTEFFCGIGGCAACLPENSHVVAIDINQRALFTYQQNFHHQTVCKSIESLPTRFAERLPQELWWMSPPCQPYTRRGSRRDLVDPRSQGLLRLVELIAQIQPANLVLENVPPFADSDGCRRLLDVLSARNYESDQIEICATDLGGINRRRRLFVVASRQGLTRKRGLPPGTCQQLRLDADVDLDQARVACDVLDQYDRAMHILDVDRGETGILRCFTAAYGRSPVRSGSHIRDGGCVRRFSPREILQLLDFPPGYTLPSWPYRALWPLVGNSLSLRCVHFALSQLPITWPPQSRLNGYCPHPLSMKNGQR